MPSNHGDAERPPIVVAITGASGAPYGVRLLEVLLAAGREVHLAVSPAGAAVITQELGRTIDLEHFELGTLLGPGAAAPVERSEALRAAPLRLHYHHYKTLRAPIASGSFLTSGMVICPCSGSTLSAVAHSIGENLIHRAAEVHLKERR